MPEAECKVGELTQDLVKAERRGSEEVLCAPIDGIVQQLIMVVPSDRAMEAEAIISNRDGGCVGDEQPAEIKIDTFSFTRYDLINGKVVSISRDAIIKDKPPDPSGYSMSSGALSDSSELARHELLYPARIALDRTVMQIDNKIMLLVPGTTVTVESKTAWRRLVEYVMLPILRYRQESLRER